ncbi:sugar phosphate isomerase/epimerase family protein [Angustibacter luteus]|uniref:Sugar phosphate isomerase/epimerase family protein n=1 Tax=Angustibacter luteus TaxID=658456 RepID=A0ABW1JB80_9ACTN
MALAVSNIAWEAAEEPIVAAELARLGVQAVEVAPTKVFADPLRVSDAEVAGYRQFWADHGVRVVAFQSMLFGHPELTVFDGAQTRAATTAHLVGFLDLAERLDAGVLVFGSPRNRRVPDAMTAEQVDDIAVAFFSDLGREAAERGVLLCIEPNPPAYDCNFVTTAGEGAALVAAVDSPGFGLHLDAAGMTLAGDDVHAAITAAPGLRHFHVSAPQLGEPEEDVVDHASAARALGEVGYAHHVSIEMRSVPGGDTVDRVARAVGLARRHYGALV